MKRFDNLNPKLLEGLSFWFWIRENTAFLNDILAGMISDYWYSPPNLFTEWQDWLWFCTIPAGYVVGFTIGPWIRKAEAFENAQPEGVSIFYNKKNIEYMTIMHTLTGDHSEAR